MKEEMKLLSCHVFESFVIEEGKKSQTANIHIKLPYNEPEHQRRAGSDNVNKI